MKTLNTLFLLALIFTTVCLSSTSKAITCEQTFLENTELTKLYLGSDRFIALSKVFYELDLTREEKAKWTFKSTPDQEAAFKFAETLYHLPDSPEKILERLKAIRKIVPEHLFAIEMIFINGTPELIAERFNFLVELTPWLNENDWASPIWRNVIEILNIPSSMDSNEEFKNNIIKFSIVSLFAQTKIETNGFDFDKVAALYLQSGLGILNTENPSNEAIEALQTIAISLHKSRDARDDVINQDQVDDIIKTLMPFRDAFFVLTPMYKNVPEDFSAEDIEEYVRKNIKNYITLYFREKGYMPSPLTVKRLGALVEQIASRAPNETDQTKIEFIGDKLYVPTADPYRLMIGNTSEILDLLDFPGQPSEILDFLLYAYPKFIDSNLIESRCKCNDFINAMRTIKRGGSINHNYIEFWSWEADFVYNLK